LCIEPNYTNDIIAPIKAPNVAGIQPPGKPYIKPDIVTSRLNPSNGGTELNEIKIVISTGLYGLDLI
jgi:hypothetical protein